MTSVVGFDPHPEAYADVCQRIPPAIRGLARVAGVDAASASREGSHAGSAGVEVLEGVEVDASSGPSAHFETATRSHRIRGAASTRRAQRRQRDHVDLRRAFGVVCRGWRRLGSVRRIDVTVGHDAR